VRAAIWRSEQSACKGTAVQSFSLTKKRRCSRETPGPVIDTRSKHFLKEIKSFRFKGLGDLGV